jgi:hypothetical protein
VPGICFVSLITSAAINLYWLSINWPPRITIIKVNWIYKLRDRWKVESAFQVVIILVVFACTGFTVLFIKAPVLHFFGGKGEMPIWASVLYYILILPIYNVLLLFYGLIFGQFRFFWSFEKRFFHRMLSIFKKKNL